MLDHHHRHLDEAAQIAASVTVDPVANDNAPDADSSQEAEPPVTKAEQRSLDARQRREARFAEAVRLREQGMTMRGVARALGVGRKTVRRWLHAGHAPTWQHADRGRSSLDPFSEYLEARWMAGSRNGTGLWREIRERGFTGQSGIVRQWAARRRRQDPTADRAIPAKLQIPMNSATYSDFKAVHRSDFKPAHHSGRFRPPGESPCRSVWVMS